MRNFKRLIILISVCIPSRIIFAIASGHYLDKLRGEGYKIEFNNHDTDIALFIFAILCLLISITFAKHKPLLRYTLISSAIAIIGGSVANMLFAVNYFYSISLIALIIYDFLKNRDHKYSTESSKRYLNIVLYLVSLFIVGGSIFAYEYNKCNMECIVPNDYGLKWRPFYEGFTDKNYFERIEDIVVDNDKTYVLREILEKEPATIEYPFSKLLSKGWKIIDGKDGSHYRIFISPSDEYVYIQKYNYNMIGVGSIWVITPTEYFNDSVNQNNSKYYHIPDFLIRITENNNRIKLSVRCLGCQDEDSWNPKFISVKDSILQLPDFTEIGIRDYDAILYDVAIPLPIRKDLFSYKNGLSFNSTNVEKISIDNNLIRIKFKDSTEKIFALRLDDLIDPHTDRLIRFVK